MLFRFCLLACLSSPLACLTSGSSEVRPVAKQKQSWTNFSIFYPHPPV